LGALGGEKKRKEKRREENKRKEDSLLTPYSAPDSFAVQLS